MLKKILFILTQIGKKKVTVLILASSIVAVLELIGIGLLVPFIGILNDTSILESNPYLNFVYKSLGFNSTSNFIIFLGLIIILATLLKNVFATIAYHIYHKYSFNIRHMFSVNMFSSYMSKNYSFFINKESSQLLRNIIELANILAHNLIIPFFLVFTNSIIILFMVIMLLVVQFKMTVLLLLFFSIFIPLLYYVVRNRLHRYSDLRDKHSTSLYKIVSQALHGIKDIKILGRELFFYKTLKRDSAIMANINSKSQTINQIPYLALEFVGISILIFIVIYLIYIDTPFSDIFILMSFYAIAAYRLLPRASELPKNMQLIKGNIYTLDIAYDVISNVDQKAINNILTNKDNTRLNFHSLEVKDLNFSYSRSDKPVLMDINLIIEKNKSNAFVGSSGAGKTTTADIILGLFPEYLKNVIVNNKELNTNLTRRWMNNIGHIPQHIYLYDDTIMANIAFGVPHNEIDHNKLDKAIDTAMLTEFIAELKDGKNTIIGERGVKLSGGQRQRVGIARALYNDPDLLIMDEATSSLDNLIETDIVNNINRLSGSKTLIIIAHRLTTIKECDVIHVLDKGKLISSGSYEYLIKHCHHFSSLANGKRLKVN